jgi:site-specific DNA-methyltransferase (adenine-specific)
MKIKNYAELLPPLKSEEAEALKASIKAEGIRVPIIVDENGTILDGYHRAKFAKRLGQPIPDQVRSGMSDAEKRAFVFQCNMARRNLEPDQQIAARKVMQKIAASLSKEGKTQQQIGALLGVAQKTVSRWLDENDSHVTKTFIRRSKVPPKAKPEIAARIEAGEKLAQVGADFGVTEQRIGQIVKAEAKAREAKEAASRVVFDEGTESGILLGKFQEVLEDIPDNSIDLIFTDPPYDEESIYLYADLSAFAARKLRPGGLCLALTGQVHFPRVLEAMLSQLQYVWLAAIDHTGGETRIRNWHIHNAFKPIIVAGKPPIITWWDWFSDQTSGGKEKDLDDLQQAESEAAYFIAALSPKDGLIVDPMCATGTTLAAAKKLGRRWKGSDIREDKVMQARKRLAT